MSSSSPDILIITGATASGKTAVAAGVASRLGSEVISADSRQVYRRMDIGTGKDYSDYVIDGRSIPVHLTDIVEPGYRYNVYEFQNDFLDIYTKLKNRSILPVVCGGSGMYIDSIVSGYRLLQVPPNEELRARLESMNSEELEKQLKSYRNLHNTTDTVTRKRLIRAIEIEEYYSRNREKESFPEIRSVIAGIRFDRETRRKRISERLRARLSEGMVEEVEKLLAEGIKPGDLIYYGLEYKYLTLYITGRINYEEMFTSLETAIHRFAKRQMTWFRGMERRGIEINWIDGALEYDRKVEAILTLVKKQ